MRPKRTTRATTRRAERARDLRHRGAQEIEQIVCPARGKMTQAPLPEEVEGQFGPQLTALIAHLTVVCRLPRSVVQRLLEGALQIPISLGSTQKAWEEASAAVAAPSGRQQQRSG